MQAAVGVLPARSVARPASAITPAAAGQRLACAAPAQRSSCRAVGGGSTAAAAARQRAALLRAAAAEGSGVGGPLGIIIECDGALVDAHGEGHRVAFNRAFEVRLGVRPPPAVSTLPAAVAVSAGCVRSIAYPTSQQPQCMGLRRCVEPIVAHAARPGARHALALAALQEIGHDCTNWSPAVFYDLMRLGDGTGEGVIAAYYSIRGAWTSVPVAAACCGRAGC